MFLILIFTSTCLFQAASAAAGCGGLNCNLAWASGFSVSNQVYYIGVTSPIVITPNAVGTGNDCATTLTYSFLSNNAVPDSTVYQISSSGVLTISTSDQTKASAAITIKLQASSTTACTTATSSQLSFTVTITSYCSTSTMTCTGTCICTIPTMTTSALSVTPDSKTLAPWYDTASLNYGTRDGFTFCGARTTKLISVKQGATTITTPTWLTVTSSTNVIQVLSNSLTDVGSYTVQIQQCLATFTTVCSTTQSITVTITACQITSITPSSVSPNSFLINGNPNTVNYPTYGQSPSCNYAVSSYSATVAGLQITVGGSAVNGLSQTAITSSSLTAQTTDRTLATTTSYTIVFTVTLSSSCLGVCTNNAGTTTLQWLDICTTTTISASTINPMSTTCLASPAVTQTFTPFTNSVSVSKNDAAYCGTYTYTVDLSQLSISGTTLSLLSTSATDYTNAAAHNGVYTATVTATLNSYSTVPSFVKSFQVTIGQCILNTLTASPTISAQSYIIGDTAQTINFPSYVQSPLCGYTVSYTSKMDGTSFTSNGLLSITSTSFIISSSTRSFASTTPHNIVLIATTNDPSLTSSSSINFDLTVTDPCLTTTLIPVTYNDISISILQTTSQTLTVNDQSSLSYGLKDGQTLCGARSYTLTYTFNSIAVTQPAFITQTSGTLQISPTTTSTQGTYTVNVVVCLTDTTLSLIPCITKSFKITILPCAVISTTHSFSLTPQTFTSYVTPQITQTLPTYTQTPSCGYSYQFVIQTTGGGTMPSFISLNQPSSSNNYIINSQSVSDQGVYNLQLVLTFISYPASLTPYTDSSVTWSVTIVNPCTTSTFNGLPTFTSMTTSVLVGTPVQQPFTEPTDSISLTYDTTLNHFIYSTLTGWDSGSNQGSNICGARTYSVSSTCASFLTVDTSLSINQPVLSLISSSNTDIGNGKICTITTKLSLYTQIVTQTVSISITSCILTGFTMDSSSYLESVQEYILMGAALSIPFPTYTQTPSCGYQITYTCSSVLASSIGAISYVSYQDGTLANLAQITTCDTTNLLYVANIKTYNPSLTDLTNYQYQGDYGIQISVSTSGAPNNKVDNSFNFYLRVINPCLYSQYSTSTYNTLTSSAIATINTSVLLTTSETFTVFEDLASQTYSSDGYTMCGTRTYSIVPSITPPSSYYWFSYASTGVNSNTITVSSTSSSDVNYIGNGGCYSFDVTGCLDVYTNICATTQFNVCIEECKPTAFQIDTSPTPQSYTIFQSQLVINSSGYTQTPLCGYGITYSATIEKTSTTTSVSSATFAATPLDSTSFTYVKFYLTDPNNSAILNDFYVYSTNTPDNGVYQIILTAVLQETKYNNLVINVNTQQTFTLTLIDPCATATVNSFSTSTDNRVLTNMAITVLGPSQSQTFYQFMDSVSRAQDLSSSSSLITTGVSTCGARTYTAGGDYTSSSIAWLFFDFVNGVITASSVSNSDINFSSNGGLGYKVTLKACLSLYPTQCSAIQTFYVQVGECKITSFANNTIQIDISQQIFAVGIDQPIVSYTQTPACGWTQTYSGAANNTAITTTPKYPSWLTLTQGTSNYWTVYSISASDQGETIVTQTVTLDDKQLGVQVNTMLSISFKVSLIDPCTTTKINPQDSAGEAFDSLLNSANKPQLITSVLVGTDTGAGTPVTKTFNTHNDSISLIYNVPGQTFVCGPRIYTVAILYDSHYSNAYIPTFASYISLTPTQSQLSVYTGLDTDIGIWFVQLTIQLADYIGIVPIITETLWVEIQSCILNQIIMNNLPQPALGLMTGYQNPDTPFSYQIYNKNAVPILTNSFIKKPLCTYPLLYELLIVNQTNTQATQSNLGLLNPSSLSTTLQFQSTDPTLDLCSYGVTNPTTQVVNYTQCAVINPYLVNFNVFISPGSFNPLSPVNNNNALKFFVWPQDPCQSATLIPDTNINQGLPIIYFLGDTQVLTQIKSTNDSISLNPNLGKSPFEGTERCGDRNYKILLQNNDEISTTTTIPLNMLNPPLITYTNNPGSVGDQILRVKSWLQNYPNITAYSNFSVTVYGLIPGGDISLKYYQILKPALTLVIPVFTISPPNPNFIIFYSTQVQDNSTGLIIQPTPSWLKFNNLTMQMKIQTSLLTDQGTYMVQIIGSVFNAYTNLMFNIQTISEFELIITKDKPPISVQIPPTFVSPLISQSFFVGESLPTYTLPQTSDANNLLVVTTIKQKLPPWLIYSTSSYSFSVQSGTTKASDVANYKIIIELSDSSGAAANYNLYIEVKALPNTTAALTAQVLQLSPIPSINSITNKGLLTILWDRYIAIPQNLTFAQISNVTYIDPDTNQKSQMPALQIQVLPGLHSKKKDLNFTWSYSSWTEKKIVIQLLFTTPLTVSHHDLLDTVQITFYSTKLFVDKLTQAPVATGPTGSVLTAKIPPQIPLRTIQKTNGRGSSLQNSAGGTIGQMISNLSISYFLNTLWSMITTQQIIVLIPLFKVQLPDNAGAFFNYLLSIASFNIIPTDTIFNWMFNIPNLPDPLNDNFSTVGFATTYWMNNIGTLALALYAFPIQIMVSWVLKRCYFNKKIMKQGIRMERALFWNQTLGTIQAAYTVIVVCAAIQCVVPDWVDGPSPYFYSLSAIFFFTVCILFPFLQAAICWINFDKLENRKFKIKFKTLYDGMKLNNKAFIYYNFWFMFRRLTLGIIVVYFRDNLFYCIAGLVNQGIIGIIIQGATNAKLEKRENQMEYFNESMILCCLYSVMCFTDFVPDAEMQYQIGYIMCGFVLFHIGINLILAFGDQVQKITWKWKRYRLMRKYAKTKGEKNIKLQKQKRHLRWKAKTEQIIQDKQTSTQTNNLNPIQEESQEESNDLNLNTYELAKANNSQNQSIISIENSEQSLNNGNPVDLNKQLFVRKTVEQPDIGKKQILQFSDNANSSDLAINRLLGRKQPADFKIDFENDVHRNIGRAIPLDQYFDDPLAVLNQDEPLEWQQLENKLKLQRQAPNNNITNLDINTGLNNVHNKLSRMTDQDYSFKNNKIKPVISNTKNGQRILADTKSVHQRLFVQHDIGDGQKLNSKQQLAQKNAQIKKRQLIVEDNNLDLKQVKQPRKGDIPVPIPRESLQQTQNPTFNLDSQLNIKENKNQTQQNPEIDIHKKLFGQFKSEQAELKQNNLGEIKSEQKKDISDTQPQKQEIKDSFDDQFEL